MKKLTDQLAKIRGEIEALNTERAEVETAPISRSECEARIAAIFDGLPNDQLLDPAPAGLANGSFDQAELEHMLSMPGLLVAAFSDQITQYLLKVYDRQTTGAEPGLPLAERRAKLKDLDAEIHALEVSEEGICEEIEAGGGDVVRRPDASAAIALGFDAPSEAA